MLTSKSTVSTGSLEKRNHRCRTAVRKTKRLRSSEVYNRTRLLAVSLIPCSRIYANGNHRIGNEAGNHDGLARFEFCLSTVRQRPHRTRACHGLLAWRRFRQERCVEWCTAPRGPLCSRSKEDSLRQQGDFCSWRVHGCRHRSRCGQAQGRTVMWPNCS